MNCELQSAETGIVAYYKFNQGFDSANNSSVTALTDAVGSNHGTLTNFALTSVTSNWKSGSTVVTGNTCATLGNSSFEMANSLKIYPNPSTGIFTITTQKNATIEVYDLVGKAIAKQQITTGSNTVNISNYASGVYLVKAISETGETATYKVVKH